MSINDFLGRSNAGNAPPAEDDTAKADFLTQYVGTFNNTGDIDGAGNNPGVFTYKTSGCTKASDNGYYFFQVLIAR